MYQKGVEDIQKKEGDCPNLNRIPDSFAIFETSGKYLFYEKGYIPS